MKMNLEVFKSFVQDLVKETGRIIMSHYLHPGLQVERKLDATPVTQVDREVETTMRDMIEKIFPEHGVLGEEHGGIREDAEYLWLLDPIDGTKSFVSGVPLFGTIICLKKEGVPLMGMIHNPVLNQLIIGDGTQTTLNDHLVKIRNQKCLEDATLLTTDDLDAKKRFGREIWCKLIDNFSLYRTWGDCYGYHLLASGNADVMIDPIVNSWDFHAMIPIVEGAGGVITDHRGKSPLNGNSVIACHADLHPLIIDQLSK